MTTWQERVAARFQPAPVDFESYAAQFPGDLIDLVDQAHGRPVRTVHQHYQQYVARCADPAAQAELVRAIRRQRARNAETLLRIQSGGGRG